MSLECRQIQDAIRLATEIFAYLKTPIFYWETIIIKAVNKTPSSGKRFTNVSEENDASNFGPETWGRSIRLERTDSPPPKK